MPRGGVRKGSGRPELENVSKSRTIRFTDEEWEQIKLKAVNDKSISDYIRRKALE